jgi:hypothetical protein
MQMAMVSMEQKPTQRMRFGEHSEGLPGSALERGMCREKRQELGRSEGLLGRLLAWVVYPQWSEQVGRTETTSRRAKGLRESDQPTVLGDGRAVHMGKGLTGIRNSQRKHKSDMQGRTNCANLTAGNKQLVTEQVIIRKRVSLKSPVR